MFYNAKKKKEITAKNRKSYEKLLLSLPNIFIAEKFEKQMQE